MGGQARLAVPLWGPGRGASSGRGWETQHGQGRGQPRANLLRGHHPFLGAVSRLTPQGPEFRDRKEQRWTRTRTGVGGESSTATPTLGGARGWSRTPSCSANTRVYLTARPWEAGLKGRTGADVVWTPPTSPYSAQLTSENK